MVKTGILTQSRYSKLLKDIRKLINDGKQRAIAAANTELVRTYWNVGKRISEAGLTDNAGYGQSVLEDLAEELDMDIRTLQRSVHFFHTYNTATSSRNLTWSHYKYLLAVNNAKERKWYEDMAEEQKWNVLQLSSAIKEQKHAQSHKALKGKSSTVKLRRPTEPTYIYKAIVERVIDGDTLLLRIDLGFAVFKEQRLRLAGIDTPPIDQPKGREAAKYVRDRLARVNFVMVKTNKIDIYGRYIGHVFYSFSNLNKDAIFTKGTYLNQELLDQGLACVL